MPNVSNFNKVKAERRGGGHRENLLNSTRRVAQNCNPVSERSVEAGNLKEYENTHKHISIKGRGAFKSPIPRTIR